MKALVYLGPGKLALLDRPAPKLEAATDAIVRVTHTTICGTDLHILTGDVPSVSAGRILGHEGVGIVEQVGSAVSRFQPGDAVLISCISSCGACANCRRGMYSHCLEGGWILGNSIDGTQAERVCVPFADTSLHHIPQTVDAEPLVMLSDIFPTGYECGVLNGRVAPGAVVAIVGAGPVGLAALLTARFYTPAELIMVDIDEHRLETARRLGATQTINSSDGRAAERLMQLTAGRGVDAAMEAVGLPATFDICQSIIAPGGVIANIGVHGTSVALHLERLWARNVTLTTRLVDTGTTPLLLNFVLAGKLQPRELITHHFKLSEGMTAYDVFSRAANNRALKVLIATE